MAQLRFKGFQTGSSVDLSNVTVGANSGSVSVPTFKVPPAVSGLPLVNSSQGVGDTITLATPGLTGIIGYDWREVGGNTLGTSASFDSTAHSGKWIECMVTCDQGTLVSPAVQIYETSMMAADDAAVIGIVPHHQATHVAIANGNWSDTTTWFGGRVPGRGAVVLIPHGRTVTYDVSAPAPRLDRVRVDGILTWALTKSTQMLVETMIGSRGSSIIIGTGPSGRLPAQYTAEVIISGRDYRTGAYIPNAIDLIRDPRLWGRGIVSQGLWRIWGTEKTTWTRANAGVPQGATSLTLEKPPAGWQVGDEICIGGTYVRYTQGPGGNIPLQREDEYRTITAIDGATISWSGGLTYPHNNQLVGSTRTDLCPVVMLRRGKNVIIRSEVKKPEYLRGHTASMHHHCTVDIWDAEFIGLGRTNKSKPAGVRNSNGEFKFYNGSTLTEPLTAQSNLISRYPVHIHHAGFKPVGSRPIVQNCYVEDVPGHAMVHHGCAADMIDNAMHLFYGCGMVSESANEVGLWVGNLALGATISDGNLNLNPKILENASGDDFRRGYGFGMRGRAMRVNRNVAVSCQSGYVFWHRKDTNAETAIAQPVDLKRADIDLKEVRQIHIGGFDKFSFVDYPIIHFADNESIGCMHGVFVSKSAPRQSHDVNVNIKRFKAWGCPTGAFVEYIGVYLLQDFDLVSGRAGQGTGLRSGGNTYQVGSMRLTTEGFQYGVFYDGGTDAQNGHNFMKTAENPRWYEIGHISVNDTNVRGWDIPDHATVDAQGPDVTRIDADWTDAYDRNAEASETWPLQIGVFDDATNSITLVTDADGQKIDSLGAGSPMFPKSFGDHMVDTNGWQHGIFMGNKGYWQHGGKNVIVEPYIISDRLTARPHKFVKTVEITNLQSAPSNGPWTYAASPVVQADKAISVATNGSVIVDVITGATGAGGPGTYELDLGDHIAPDHGNAVLDDVAGRVTYTPDKDYVGTDEMYVFVKSQGRFATVKLNFLINAGATANAIRTPIVDTHFSAAGVAGQIDVTLGAAPDTDGRRIVLTEYSTDGGATWRRLCNGWKPATHKLTTGSSGSALSAGGHGIRLRYKTNHEGLTSPASADDAVTVA